MTSLALSAAALAPSARPHTCTMRNALRRPAWTTRYCQRCASSPVTPAIGNARTTAGKAPLAPLSPGCNSYPRALAADWAARAS
eukprot:481845-Lingulodinium_polyedra.AAC.1